jgi:hypothetical protein
MVQHNHNGEAGSVVSKLAYQQKEVRALGKTKKRPQRATRLCATVESITFQWGRGPKEGPYWANKVCACVQGVCLMQ